MLDTWQTIIARRAAFELLYVGELVAYCQTQCLYVPYHEMCDVWFSEE